MTKTKWTIFLCSLVIFTSLPTAHSADLPLNLFVNLAKKINPAVVNITALGYARGFQRFRQFDDPFDLFENLFLGPQGSSFSNTKRTLKPMGVGTGFIIRKDGLILTNYHVIANAAAIQVQLFGDQRTYVAKYIGGDQRTDLALIQIRAKKRLPRVRLGNSDKLQVGEWVTAFGNALGRAHSVTKGIVSGIGRRLDDINLLPFIQTDASINRGNSGGPLVNTRGEVIGVNTAIDARGQGQGFAIPINAAKKLLPALEKHGRIKWGYIGVNLYPAQLSSTQARELKIPTTEGVLITRIFPTGPGARYGLKKYDFITRVNGKNIRHSQELYHKLKGYRAGDRVTLRIIRQGKVKKISVVLGDYKAIEVQRRKNRR